MDLSKIIFIIGAIIFFVGLRQFLKKVFFLKLLLGISGIIVGCILANLFFKQVIILAGKNFLESNFKIFSLPFSFLKITVILGLAYLGMMVFLQEADRLPSILAKREYNIREDKILDTSVIIDGRILDICEAGFLEGILLIPRFVLDELQQVADSSDSVKRTRGRRGLDILNKMQKKLGMKIKIEDKDYPHIREVDSKIIELAKELKAKILTNDLNLNKIAELQNIGVLNINDLADAMKPIVLPGEEITLQIVKEGKEIRQGLGYLDDGTMVVIEDGAVNIGKTVKVIVTSIHQTTAGRMIFAK